MNEAETLFLAAARAGVAAARAVVLTGSAAGAALCLTADGRRAGSLGSPEVDAAALASLHEALARGLPVRLALFPPAEQVFIAVALPPERILIIGAVHTAIPLVTFANTLGFETIVIDNRSAFATPERFGHASRLLRTWPADALARLHLRASDSLVFLTHDAKIDNPALTLALRSPARYIGALGSRATHARRLEALRADGAPPAEFARIHAPIGLNLGGRSPEEIALAILAEIVQVKYA